MSVINCGNDEYPLYLPLINSLCLLYQIMLSEIIVNTGSNIDKNFSQKLIVVVYHHFVNLNVTLPTECIISPFA